MTRTYLNVPYQEKDEAKKLGARWDASARRWYVPEGMDTAPLVRWLPVEKPESLKPKSTEPRLTVELVPQTCWYSNVRSEVSTGEWDKLKRVTFEQANYCCEVCSGRGLKHPVECHEIWDYNDERHIQTLTGLIALCPACHECKHMGLANIKGRGAIATDHLAKVNLQAVVLRSSKRATGHSSLAIMCITSSCHWTAICQRRSMWIWVL